MAVVGAAAACAYVVRRLLSCPTAHGPPAAVPTGPVARVERVEASSAAVPVSARLEPADVALPEAPTAERKRTWEPVELPPKPLISGALIATVAAVAGIGAIALGMWAFATSVRAAERVVAAPTVETPSQELISFLAKPSTKRIPLDGSRGRLVLAVGSAGRGVLVLDGLASAPAGRSYQAWVIRPRAKVPRSAAVFSGAETFVQLSVPVRRGSILAISVEPAGGSRAPTRTPTFVAHRD